MGIPTFCLYSLDVSSFSCFIALARSSGTMCRTVILFLISEEEFSPSVKYDVSCGLFRYGLCYVEAVLVNLLFFFSVSVLVSWKGVEFCQMLLPHQWIELYSFCHSLCWYGVSQWFFFLYVVNHPCLPAITSTWWWHILLLMRCQNQFASIFLSISASILIIDINI